MAVLAAVTMAAPAQAAADAPGYGVTIGGMINADMGWQVLGNDNIQGNNTDSSITNFFATINSDSYLRATFTSADKNTGALIELGVSAGQNVENDGSSDGDNNVSLRYAYGWWKVGSCKLLVGQMDGRLADGGASQALGDIKSGKGGLAGFGFIGATRNPKVALQMDVNDNFGFEVSLGQAGAETNTFGSLDAALQDVSSTNSYLPRLEVVFDFNFGNFTFGVGGGIAYQEYKISDGTTNGFNNNDYDDSALSWLIWVPVEYTNGPFSVVLNAHYGHNVDTDWTGENTSEYGGNFNSVNGIYGGQPGSLPFYNGTDVEDTKQWGVGIDFNFELTEQLGLAVGGGVTNLSNDAWEINGQGNDDYTRWAVYVALPYAVTDNFTIQPEVGYYNYGDKVGPIGADEEDEAGDEWLVGVHFQFLF